MNRIYKIREQARAYYNRHAEQYAAYQRKRRTERKLHPTRPDWKHCPPKTKAQIREYFHTAAALDIPYTNTYSVENRDKLDKLKLKLYKME